MDSFIALDLETTGFSPDTCDIIEIGAWKVEEGVVVDKFCTLVKPICYIPREIQNLTKITMDDVADCEPIESILPSFFEWCESYPFLGHNLKFDYDFLCVKGKRLGLDFTLNNKRTGLDTLDMARKFLRLQDNKLHTVASYFNIVLDTKQGGFHRASYDAYIVKLIYDRFLFNCPSAQCVKLPELLNRDEKKYGKVVNNDTLSFS